MHSANTLWFLTLALTACAGSSARQPVAQASTRALVQPANPAASRLGPPSPRGIGLRRVDRPATAQLPLALY